MTGTDIVQVDWRTSLALIARCWFGHLLLVLAFAGFAIRGHTGEVVAALLGVLAAAALLGSLLALVIASLAEHPMHATAHALVAGLAVGIVIALVAPFPFAVVGAIVGVIPALAGTALTSGSPTWRRWLGLPAGALLLGLAISWLYTA